MLGMGNDREKIKLLKEDILQVGRVFDDIDGAVKLHDLSFEPHDCTNQCIPEPRNLFGSNVESVLQQSSATSSQLNDLWETLLCGLIQQYRWKSGGYRSYGNAVEEVRRVPQAAGREEVHHPFAPTGFSDNGRAGRGRFGRRAIDPSQQMNARCRARQCLLSGLVCIIAEREKLQRKLREVTRRLGDTEKQMLEFKLEHAQTSASSATEARPEDQEKINSLSIEVERLEKQLAKALDQTDAAVQEKQFYQDQTDGQEEKVQRAVKAAADKLLKEQMEALAHVNKQWEKKMSEQKDAVAAKVTALEDAKQDISLLKRKEYEAHARVKELEGQLAAAKDRKDTQADSGSADSQQKTPGEISVGGGVSAEKTRELQEEVAKLKFDNKQLQLRLEETDRKALTSRRDSSAEVSALAACKAELAEAHAEIKRLKQAIRALEGGKAAEEEEEKARALAEKKKKEAARQKKREAEKERLRQNAIKRAEQRKALEEEMEAAEAKEREDKLKKEEELKAKKAANKAKRDKVRKASEESARRQAEQQRRAEEEKQAERDAAAAAAAAAAKAEREKKKKKKKKPAKEKEEPKKTQSGYGKCVYGPGEWYEGMWEDFERHGEGTYHWPDGRKYEGEWVRDKKHGLGRYYWSDGDRYEGEYRNDKMDGQGTYFFSDGTRYQGAWKDDMSHGKGAFFYHDGAKYEGEFTNDRKHGVGLMTHVNGDVFQEHWVNGRCTKSVQVKANSANVNPAPPPGKKKPGKSRPPGVMGSSAYV